MAVAKEKKVKLKNPKGEKIRTIVSFKLTDEEKAKKAEIAAHASSEHADLVIKKKAEVEKFNAKIKTASAQVTKLLLEINNGFEEREAECIEVKNFEGNEVEYWLDGVIVKRRELTENDRQEKFQLDAASKSKRKWQKPSDAFDEANEDFLEDIGFDTQSVDEEKKKKKEIKKIIKEQTNLKTAKTSIDGVIQ